MNRCNHYWLKLTLGAPLAWLCGSAISNAQPYSQPPPVGAGIVAALQVDQSAYTNQAPAVWCPPCVTNIPPCLAPCYLIEGKTAVAQFVFAVTNDYNLPRAFEFSSGQQFDLDLIDQTGRVVAAWSDDKLFTQELTSFSLRPGEANLFLAEVALEDRDGQPLNGLYQGRAFLTTSGPFPRVEATTKFWVTLASPP